MRNSTDHQTTETIFYDGHCGLCQRWVRFVLLRDRTGQMFRFAPLHGERFHAAVPEHQRAGLPDSVVVLAVGGSLLVRSEAVLHILRRLGGVWACIAAMARLLPRRWRDWLYDRVVNLRHRLFPPTTDACPPIPSHMRERFDL
ncbi:MAG: DUF393 domain-containing protein [Acidobacteriota bacterium]|nr:DUF393 domain-containing protein [Blastocatellia bacterium]MDW8240673.1 DUF393 domain-containing protein [Acidobacteriota bacterium]